MKVLETRDSYGESGVYLAQSAFDQVTAAGDFKSRGDAIQAIAAALEVAWTISAAINKEAQGVAAAVQRGMQADLARHLRTVLADILARWSAETEAGDKADAYHLLEHAAAWAMVGIADPVADVVFENFDGAGIAAKLPDGFANSAMGAPAAQSAIVLM